MDQLSSMVSSSEAGKVVNAYKKALTTAATVSAYAMLARSMAREFLPDELRAAMRWGLAVVRARFGAGAGEKERHSLVIRLQLEGRPFNGPEGNDLFNAVRTYLATKINPRAMRRLCLARSHVMKPDGGTRHSTLLYMEPGGSTTDVFDGIEFSWLSIDTSTSSDDGTNDKVGKESLEVSFDAEHTDTAINKYVPFILAHAEELSRKDRALKIFMNEGSWRGITHHHPATFDTLAMDPALKQSVIDDLDRFLKRRDYYRRIGKAWKRGYLLYGPPGTGKSSLVAAMANYLRFNLYDLDLSQCYCNTSLQNLLITMSNKSILIIEDIDCCIDTKSREDRKKSKIPGTARDQDDSDDDHMDDDDDVHVDYPGAYPERKITLSGLLNFIDGLWSTTGEERIIVFTTNYKERLDPALLRPGRMDMHVYMGYCCWDAFRTLAQNYHLVDDHPLFPEIQELLAVVEVTPAEVSEMLLRSEDADVAMGLLKEFLEGKRLAGKEAEDKQNDVASEEKAL